MSSLPSRNQDRARNLAVGCSLLFLTGSLYSVGVFNEPVEQSAGATGALKGVWSSAIVWTTLVCTPVMLLAGVVMSDPEEEDSPVAPAHRAKISKTSKIRFLSSIGALCFFTMALAAIGVTERSPFFLRTAVLLQGVPFGIYYLVCLELLAAWVPSRPGLAVGIGQMSFGLGSIFFSSFFEYLLQRFQCSTTFLIAAMVLGVPSAANVFLMEWPCEDESAEETESDFTDRTNRQGTVISWRKLPLFLPFWYYVLSILAGQVGFAFIPYFFKIGSSFGQSTDAVVLSFQIAILCSTIARPFLGLLADALKWGSGPFSHAAKNLTFLLLATQLAALLGLVSFSTSSNFIGFVVCSCFILIVFAGSAVGAPVLGRDMFGTVNSALVFGIGTSVAMGCGEFIFGVLMGAIDSAASAERVGPAKYNLFYMLSAAVSVFGIMSCTMIRTYIPPSSGANANPDIVRWAKDENRTNTDDRLDVDGIKTFYGAVP